MLLFIFKLPSFHLFPSNNYFIFLLYLYPTFLYYFSFVNPIFIFQNAFSLLLSISLLAQSASGC